MKRVLPLTVIMLPMTISNFLQGYSNYATQQMTQQVNLQSEISVTSNDTEIDQEKALALETDAEITKIEDLEFHRLQMIKSKQNWELFIKQFPDSERSTCDLICSKECFEYNQELDTLQLLLTCLVPKCNCLSHVPAQNNYDIIPTKIAQIQLPKEYNLSQQCDLECHEECEILEQYSQFDVQLQCVRYKCNCFYELERSIEDQLEIVNMGANILDIVEDREVVESVPIIITQSQFLAYTREETQFKRWKKCCKNLKKKGKYKKYEKCKEKLKIEKAKYYEGLESDSDDEEELVEITDYELDQMELQLDREIFQENQKSQGELIFTIVDLIPVQKMTNDTMNVQIEWKLVVQKQYLKDNVTYNVSSEFPLNGQLDMQKAMNFSQVPMQPIPIQPYIEQQYIPYNVVPQTMSNVSLPLDLNGTTQQIPVQQIPIMQQYPYQQNLNETQIQEMNLNYSIPGVQQPFIQNVLSPIMQQQWPFIYGQMNEELDNQTALNQTFQYIPLNMPYPSPIYNQPAYQSFNYSQMELDINQTQPLIYPQSPYQFTPEQWVNMQRQVQNISSQQLMNYTQYQTPLNQVPYWSQPPFGFMNQTVAPPLNISEPLQNVPIVYQIVIIQNNLTFFCPLLIQATTIELNKLLANITELPLEPLIPMQQQIVQLNFTQFQNLLRQQLLIENNLLQQQMIKQYLNMTLEQLQTPLVQQIPMMVNGTLQQVNITSVPLKQEIIPQTINATYQPNQQNYSSQYPYYPYETQVMKIIINNQSYTIPIIPQQQPIQQPYIGQQQLNYSTNQNMSQPFKYYVIQTPFGYQQVPMIPQQMPYVTPYQPANMSSQIPEIAIDQAIIQQIAQQAANYTQNQTLQYINIPLSQIPYQPLPVQYMIPAPMQQMPYQPMISPTQQAPFTQQSVQGQNFSANESQPQSDTTTPQQYSGSLGYGQQQMPMYAHNPNGYRLVFGPQQQPLGPQTQSAQIPYPLGPNYMPYQPELIPQQVSQIPMTQQGIAQQIPFYPQYVPMNVLPYGYLPQQTPYIPEQVIPEQQVQQNSQQQNLGNITQEQTQQQPRLVHINQMYQPYQRSYWTNQEYYFLNNNPWLPYQFQQTQPIIIQNPQSVIPQNQQPEQPQQEILNENQTITSDVEIPLPTQQNINITEEIQSVSNDSLTNQVNNDSQPVNQPTPKPEGINQEGQIQEQNLQEQAKNQINETYNQTNQQQPSQNESIPKKEQNKTQSKQQDKVPIPNEQPLIQQTVENKPQSQKNPSQPEQSNDVAIPESNNTSNEQQNNSASIINSTIQNFELSNQHMQAIAKDLLEEFEATRKNWPEVILGTIFLCLFITFLYFIFKLYLSQVFNNPIQRKHIIQQEEQDDEQYVQTHYILLDD